jgi:DNA-binding transcriptional LysR family regulator
MDPRPPSLDHLKTFLAVAEAGSFAGAARRLGRATSVVSYAIANLESQLGLALFERKATRRPQLTEAGRAILADSRGIAQGMDGLLARARGLIGGLEAEVAIAVDVMLPASVLVQALNAFRAEFPTVGLRLYVEALGAVTQLVLDGVASVGVSGPLPRRMDAIEQGAVGMVKLIAVAADSHPLARRKGALTTAILREHVQLVLTDRSTLTRGQDFSVIATQTWRLADLGAKHALLLAGLGWGSMPEWIVREDIAAGRLVRLAISTWEDSLYPLQSLHRADRPPGPAGRWLIQRLRELG